jgi:hypothetical protein
MAGSWSADQETDGHIPDHMIEEWGASKTQVEWLLKSGLWESIPDEDQSYPGVTEAEVRFRNWAEYQPTKAKNEHTREKNREKLRHWRERNRVTDEDVTGLQDGSDPVSNPAPVPSRPDPSRPVHKDSSKTDEEFDQWYSGYPKKEAKAAAKKAFATARKNVDFDTLMAGLERYVKSVKGKDRQYIALPASWLNAGRWEDELVAQLPGPKNDPYWWANQ